MPRKASDKPVGFPCPPELCGKGGASRHLDPNEFKMYDAMMAFAKAGQKARGHKHLVCTASVVPTLSNAYPCGENQARSLIDRLCKKGWAIRHDGGRDPKTGGRLPSTYEMIEHDDYIKLHPGTCPPNFYAPDYVTAEAHGMQQRGDRMKTDFVPQNFWKPETLLKDIDPTVDISTAATRAGDAEVAALWEGMSPEQREVWNNGLIQAREALRRPSPSIVEEGQQGPSHSIVEEGDPDLAPQSSADLAPQSKGTLPHNRREPSSTIVGSILERAVLETPTHTPHPTEPEACVCRVLEKGTIKYNWLATSSQRKEMITLAEKYGMRFEQVAMLFISDPPSMLDRKTGHPWKFFVENFGGLLARLTAADSYEGKATEAQLAATELNALHGWCLNNPGHKVVAGKIVRTAPKEDEPDPEALFEEPK